MSEITIEQITLEKANLIIQNSIKKAREIKINPIMVVVLDHRGAIKACLGEDGISSLRFKIAHGKANGAFQMGMDLEHYSTELNNKLILLMLQMHLQMAN